MEKNSVMYYSSRLGAGSLSACSVLEVTLIQRFGLMYIVPGHNPNLRDELEHAQPSAYRCDLI